MGLDEPFASREGEGMGLEVLFAAHEEGGTRLEEQVVRLEESTTRLEEQGMRLAAELSGSAGGSGFFDNLIRCQAIRGGAGRASVRGTEVEESPGIALALPGNLPPLGEVYNVVMEMLEALLSFICLVSLIVILLEAQRAGELRRRVPVALWAVSLVLLALLALVRVWANLDVWSDVRILMGTVSVGNFLFGAGLLVRWLAWRPAAGG